MPNQTLPPPSGYTCCFSLPHTEQPSNTARYRNHKPKVVLTGYVRETLTSDLVLQSMHGTPKTASILLTISGTTKGYFSPENDSQGQCVCASQLCVLNTAAHGTLYTLEPEVQQVLFPSPHTGDHS